MPRIELFPFRFRAPLTARWVRARCKASRDELVQPYGEGRYEITGPLDVRNVGAFVAPQRETNPARLAAWKIGRRPTFGFTSAY